MFYCASKALISGEAKLQGKETSILTNDIQNILVNEQADGLFAYVSV